MQQQDAVDDVEEKLERVIADGTRPAHAKRAVPPELDDRSIEMGAARHDEGAHHAEIARVVEPLKIITSEIRAKRSIAHVEDCRQARGEQRLAPAAPCHSLRFGCGARGWCSLAA